MRSIQLVAVAMLAAASLSQAVGCGSTAANQSQSGVGVVRLPLTASVGANNYVLSGTFVITNSTGVTTTLSTSASQTAATLMTTLAVGQYTVTLLPGWQLSLVAANGTTTPITASLISPVTQSVTITNQQNTIVTYQFNSNGTVIQLGQGQMTIQIGVTESAGGATSAGGAPSVGGTAAGGTPATGGTAAIGGSTAACVESTCGSHKWPCWRMPNPANNAATVPNHQSYTDLGAGGAGAIRDNITCLVWEKVNPAAMGSWQNSYDRCAALATSSFAGYNDWRLPSRVEVASIVDLHGSIGFAPVFTTTSGYYATSSWWYETISGQSTAGFEFGYGLNGFASNAIPMASSMVSRCVRGNGTGEAYNAYAVEPPNHYIVTGTGANAIVTDNYTKLMWQQSLSASTLAWSAGPAYCAAQTTGSFTDWRVPTLNELASTVDESHVSPAINRVVFPATPSCGSTTWFWASDASSVGGTAWGLNYCDGYTGWNGGASGAWNDFTVGYVRCVRGG
jgi:hypothetical protein